MSDMKELVSNVLDKEVEAINTLKDNFPYKEFDEVVNFITKKLKGKIVVTGLGKSGDVGKRLATTLTSTGTTAVYLHCVEASHGDMGIINDNDIVIALSNSGETKEMADVISYTRRFNIKLISICSNPESALATSADINLIIPSLPEVCLIGKAPTTSIILLTSMVNLLIVALEKTKKFTSDMYKNWHPHGKLGISLIKVSELMHTASEIPLVNKEADMTRVLDVMSKKIRFGCVGVVDDDNKLCGIFTDGDIRHKLVEGVDIINKKVKDVMKENPKTIDASSLASAALLKINENNIQVLFVVDADNHPVGVISFHDLLRAGIA